MASAMPDPKDVLQTALPSLGFTLSTDADNIYDSIWRRCARILGRNPKRGEMRAVVTAWIEWAKKKETGTEAKSMAMYRAALASYRPVVTEHIVKVGDKYRLLSKKGKNLGTFDSHAAAAKHEGEVEYFKAHEETHMKPFTTFVTEAADKCIYCTSNPVDPKFDPYCSARCAAMAELDEQSLGDGQYTGAPEYKDGKSPMTEDEGKDPRLANVPWKPQTQADRDFDARRDAEDVKRDARKAEKQAKKDKAAGWKPVVRPAWMSEGEPTGSEGSLYGGPTGSIGEDVENKVNVVTNENGSYDVVKTSTGEVLANFDSMYLAKRMVQTINGNISEAADAKKSLNLPRVAVPKPQQSFKTRRNELDRNAKHKGKQFDEADITKDSDTYFGVTKEGDISMQGFTAFSEMQASPLNPLPVTGRDHRYDRELGEGGVAPVYEGEDFATGTAVKITRAGTKGYGKPAVVSGAPDNGYYPITSADGKESYGVWTAAGLKKLNEDGKRPAEIGSLGDVKNVNGMTMYRVFNGKGEAVWVTVPPRPQDEDTEGIMSEEAQAPKRNKFFGDLVAKHRDLPVRYRDNRDKLTAESTDKATLHTIAVFAHENGLRTALEKSVYEWDSTWILSISGFKK